jgi:2-methylisocitrate lyase-like PEP mutase family enzyme
MRRARAYVEAGVDAMFFSFLPNDRIATVGAELNVPIMNVVTSPKTAAERAAVVETGLRICVYTGHIDLYRANAEALWNLASVIAGEPAPELPATMKEWLAYGIPAPLRSRLGGGDLAERFGWTSTLEPLSQPAS